MRGLELPDDVTVSFLVDLSGSMAGRPLAEACYGVLAATLALEDLGAKVSVLGYTTAKTNRPADEFQKDRVVRHPGRLGESVMVVAKDAGRPAANEIGSVLAMAVLDTHGENLDGEAVIWAARRLVAERGEGKKILVLLTDDFEPRCEKSLRWAADHDFMKKHLKEVVAELDASDEVEFAQVVLAEDYQLRKQDTYADPRIAKTKAGDISRAIVDALAPSFELRQTRTLAASM